MNIRIISAIYFIIRRIISAIYFII
jgi:hypothetical protein